MSLPAWGFTEPFSSMSHLLTAVLAAIGGYLLIQRGRGNFARVFALSVYTFALVFLFSMSGVYHLLEIGSPARAVLQRLDYAGIWILIAGTFTPIHAILFRGAWRWGILLFVWAVAITGLVLQIIYFTSFPEWLGLMFFLSLGWLGAATGVQFHRLFQHNSIRWLLAGGIFYSIGAIYDFAKGPYLLAGIIGPHEVFHVFVILGALSHWLFIWNWSSHPVLNQIKVQIRMFGDNKYIASVRGENLVIEGDDLQKLKVEIRLAIEKKYHPRPTPPIHLKYSKEEVL